MKSVTKMLIVSTLAKSVFWKESKQMRAWSLELLSVFSGEEAVSDL